VALESGHRPAYELFIRRSTPRVRFLEAAFRGDESAARQAMGEDPSLPGSLTADEHGYLAHAIHHSRVESATLMLRLGFDPKAPGVDGGSALHQAAWVGSLEIVEALIRNGSVPIDLHDPTHDGTPLGWAAYGSVHRCARGADYIGVINRLVAAGAVVDARAMDSAEGNDAVQEALRNHVRR
jgi:ankyrin repeat protein